MTKLRAVRLLSALCLTAVALLGANGAAAAVEDSASCQPEVDIVEGFGVIVVFVRVCHSQSVTPDLAGTEWVCTVDASTSIWIDFNGVIGPRICPFVSASVSSDMPPAGTGFGDSVCTP
ncbi:MAG: hypothetical protein ACRDUY_09355 [Nitriliruptorales bacterium]